MRVLVLGAGASYGASDFVGVRPPLVSQFFSAASTHGLLEEELFHGEMDALQHEIEETGGDWSAAQRILDADDLSTHLGALRSFVAHHMGVAPTNYHIKPIDIERLFGLIEAELLGRHGLHRLQGQRPGITPADVLKQQLYLVICGALLASTRDVRCEYHQSLADWLDPGDLVVSFNYDLLMDRALGRRGDWVINDGYAVDFHRVGRRRGEDVEWREPLATRSAITLLKPHGSLNWLYCQDPWESQVNASLRGRPTREPPVILYGLDDLHPEFESDFPLFEWWGRYEHDDQEGYSYDLHSLIVPPAITKQYRDFEPLIGHLWARAVRQILTEAEELIFIGYSLRPEDLRSWWLFRTIAMESGTLDTVSVVDPSAKVLERFSNVFENQSVSHAADTLEEFAGQL